MAGAAIDPTLYSEYRSETEGVVLARALGRAAFVLFAINTAFVGVDWIIYPDKFADFLPTRIGLDLVLLAIFAWTRHSHPVASSFGICWSGGWMLLTVIHGTGGAASDYYTGLVLLFIGIGVLGPLSARQAALAIGAIFAGYVAVSVFGETVGSTSSFALKAIFLAAAAFTGVFACGHLDRMRYSDFMQRREIEKARDELRELDVAKSRFTANIHHELRTPLTLTLAPVEAMLAGDFGDLSELQRSYLGTIRSNALRLLKLINNLLDLAKIESQQLEVKRRPVQIGSIADEIVAGAVPLAVRKRVSLATRQLDALPVIHADPDAVEKVVVNLLGNALKFTDAGESIEIRGEATEGGGVHLTVADTGIGIPPDQLARVFDRFAQVDGSTTRRHEGTGIGLSLVKELVELHGGRIWAESEGAGQGTQMHVVFPLGESDLDGAAALEDVVLESATLSGAGSNALAAMEAELELDGPGDASFGDDLRLAELRRNVERVESSSAEAPDAAGGAMDAAAEVLIVEDNPDMRRLLGFLVGQEFRTRTARNGREGLARVREKKPDLVLTDVMMPEMSGTELCAALKSDPETAGIPVVLVTSKAEREMKIEGLELGADDYVTKPFHPRELLARVRSLVKLRRVQDELAIRNALLVSTNEELQSTMVELRDAGAQLVQAERLAAVGELAAGVAHEVNNPVNFALNAMKTLLTYVDDIRQVTDQVAALIPEEPDKLRSQLRELAALRERLDFDQAADALVELGGIVAEGLTRTSRLVGDLRDFAAPGGQVSANVDVARGLRSTAQLVSHTLADANATLDLDIPESLPPVEGDAGGINQVFLNLLKNAAEAFQGRRGTVTVRARPEGSWILVEIRDDGPGLAPEMHEQVFEPFFTTKEAGRGTGLGLSISRRIVNEHGGDIELHSALGEGCCFRIRLPIRAEHAQAGQRSEPGGGTRRAS